MIRWLREWWRARRAQRVAVEHVRSLLLADSVLWQRAMDLHHAERLSAIATSSTPKEAARRLAAASADFDARERYRRRMWLAPSGALSLADQPTGGLTLAESGGVLTEAS